jgi:(2Fe-2S) ferredoxin
MVTPKYHIFVCVGSKLVGTNLGMCNTRGGVKLAKKISEEIEDRELSGEVMLSTTSCFGICDKGPVLVIYPEGVWYGGIDEEKVEQIFDSHIEGGKPVESLRI